MIATQVLVEDQRRGRARDDRVVELDVVVEVEAEFLQRHPRVQRQIGQHVRERHSDLTDALEDEKTDEVVGLVVDVDLVGFLQEVEVDDVSDPERVREQTVLRGRFPDHDGVDLLRHRILGQKLDVALPQLIAEEWDPVEGAQALIDRPLALACRAEDVS